ncbi:MAG: hypothetical protein CL946_00125 [Ectothiorhodospiraceae bacterium]|nr:hypothetical protein [Ectothiorhodospiraceae bacterium]
MFGKQLPRFGAMKSNPPDFVEPLDEYKKQPPATKKKRALYVVALLLALSPLYIGAEHGEGWLREASRIGFFVLLIAAVTVYAVRSFQNRLYRRGLLPEQRNEQDES